MNIQNNLQGLQQLFSSEAVTQTAGKTGASPSGVPKPGTDQATLSSAASVAAAAAPDSDVRMEKVTAIQQAIAAGTYQVPASAVAGKMIDHMMGK
ncbi:MAG: flagellar biosynthesis anti-sigma factor FlgM [Acidobacteriota bacterium]